MEETIARHFGIRQNLIVPNISWGLGVHECDVLVVRPSGIAIEVEIKRSRADLLADFKKGHGHKSKKIGQLYYAIPSCLYESCADLIPEHAGILELWKHEQRGWWYCTVRKEAPKNGNRKLTEKEILKVARLGTMRIWSLKRKVIELSKEKPA